MSEVLSLLREAREFREEFAPGLEKRFEYWKQAGAKEGDARIIAQLEDAGVACLVSENRHFVREIANLPFSVRTSREALQELGL
jgi:hypothetical protein